MSIVHDTGVYFDPYDVGINADPYPTYARLRDELFATDHLYRSF